MALDERAAPRAHALQNLATQRRCGAVRWRGLGRLARPLDAREARRPEPTRPQDAVSRIAVDLPVARLKSGLPLQASKELRRVMPDAGAHTQGRGLIEDDTHGNTDSSTDFTDLHRFLRETAATQLTSVLSN